MSVLKLAEDLFNTLQFEKEWDFHNGVLNIIKGPIIPFVVTVIFLGMSGIIVIHYLDIAFWRHDSFNHTPDVTWYEGNLREEGRWINYFLFDLIKFVPGKLAAIANIYFLGLYGYLCASSIIKDQYLRVIFGLSLLMLPVLHAQNLWPNITMLPILALPCFYFLSKKIHPFILFSVAAIFYFGTLSQFYFLIPLIYLGDINQRLSGELIHDAKYTIGRVLLPYTLCFVLGFLVANAIVLMSTGESITLGEWRKATPATDLNQLMDNFFKIHERLFIFSSKVFSTAYSLIWLALIPFLIISLDKKKIWILLVLFVMLLSTFYTTLYHGVDISDRTLVPTLVPLVTIFFVIPGIKFKSNLLHIILCLTFIFPFFKDSSNFLKLYCKIGGYYKHQIQQVLSLVPQNEVQNISVFVTENEVIELNHRIKDHLNLEFKWSEELSSRSRTIVTALRSFGYYEVLAPMDEQVVDDVKSQLKSHNGVQPYLIFPLDNRPGIYGIIQQNGELDTELLDSL